MAKLSKRRKLMEQKVDLNKTYTVEAAVEALSGLPPAKFRESLDIAVNLGIDPRKSDQTVRGATLLPHGNGKQTRVAVFTNMQVDKARAAGADAVGMADLAEQIKGGDLNFDVVIASPDAMRVVSTLGPILGPRGLMPNPKTGTVTVDVESAVRNAKSGQMQFRNDRKGVVHGSIGCLDFTKEQVRENIEAVLADLRKAKPASSKGTYIKKLTLSTTMGVGLVIDRASLDF